MKNSKIVFPFLLLLLISMGTQAQLPKGDRTLAFQVDMTQNMNFDSAFGHAQSLCIESVHSSFWWQGLEPSPNQIGGPIFDLINVVDWYYSSKGVQVELQIAPINGPNLEMPSDLQNTAFDDPQMIARFNTLLDSVFAHLPTVELAALNIGNEHDFIIAGDTVFARQYATFLDSVSTHAKDLYFAIHGTDLKVGTTLTFDGLTAPSTRAACHIMNENTDIISTTYYPLNNDFTMESPTVVYTDFTTLTTEYPDTLQPIYFTECGYASSTFCNSSEAQQADFYRIVFDAWDQHINHIPYITIFKSTDWSATEVNDLAMAYGINDTIFKEYLRTLGVRTFPRDGMHKEAFEQIRCEVDSRGWCAAGCNLTGIPAPSLPSTVQVFPNPATTSFQVKWETSHSPVTIRMIDMQGKAWEIPQTKSPGSLHVSTEGLPKGIYLLGIVWENGSPTLHKIVIE